MHVAIKFASTSKLSQVKGELPRGYRLTYNDSPVTIPLPLKHSADSRQLSDLGYDLAAAFSTLPNVVGVTIHPGLPSVIPDCFVLELRPKIDHFDWVNIFDDIIVALTRHKPGIIWDKEFDEHLRVQRGFLASLPRSANPEPA